jgi:hypothetical protein
MYPSTSNYYAPQPKKRRTVIWIAIIITLLALVTVLIAAITVTSTGTKSISRQFVEFVAVKDGAKSFAMLSSDVQENKGADGWDKEVQQWNEVFGGLSYIKELSPDEKLILGLANYSVHEFSDTLTDNEPKKVLVIIELDEITKNPSVAGFYAE